MCFHHSFGGINESLIWLAIIMLSTYTRRIAKDVPKLLVKREESVVQDRNPCCMMVEENLEYHCLDACLNHKEIYEASTPCGGES
jgi:hypothetical protein